MAVAISMGFLSVLIMKWLFQYIKDYSWYKYFKMNTYEMYMYSCPLSYVILYFSYQLWGDSIYMDSTISILVFLLRIILQIIGSILMIELVRVLRLKNLIQFRVK